MFKNVKVGVEPAVLPDRFHNRFTLGYNTYPKIVDPLTGEIIPKREPLTKPRDILAKREKTMKKSIKNF